MAALNAADAETVPVGVVTELYSFFVEYQVSGLTGSVKK